MRMHSLIGFLCSSIFLVLLRGHDYSLLEHVPWEFTRSWRHIKVDIVCVSLLRKGFGLVCMVKSRICYLFYMAMWFLLSPDGWVLFITQVESILLPPFLRQSRYRTPHIRYGKVLPYARSGAAFLASSFLIKDSTSPIHANIPCTLNPASAKAFLVCSFLSHKSSSNSFS